MKFKGLIAVTLFLMVAGGWWLSERSSRDVSSPVEPEAGSWVQADEPQLKLQRDEVEVFKRAFWKRPTAAERILHAERRHWVAGETELVEQWQWFIEVEPGEAFTAWLFQENPFGLTPLEAGQSLPQFIDGPAWLPAAGTLAKFDAYRKPGAGFYIFHDPINRRLIAMDAGGGFTVAQNQL